MSTLKDEKHSALLNNVVKPETFNDDEHVTPLLNVVYHVTYNNVFIFIETPWGFKWIVSQYPTLVFNNMLLIEGAAMVKSPMRSWILFESFVDEGKVTIDLFPCSFGVEKEKIKIITKDYFDVNALNIDAYYLTRGN